MKKILSFFLATALVFSLSACSTVDMNTPKSEELSKQYNYYADSMNKLRGGMNITPEQADEVFIVLSSCGIEEAITNVIDNKDSSFSVHYGSSFLDVTMKDGAVEKVLSGYDTIYPEYSKYNILTHETVKEEKLKSNDGTVVAKYAYIKVSKSELKECTQENFKEFADTVVKNSGYDWFSIVCNDDTGINFIGSSTEYGSYGKIAEGKVVELIGAIELSENGDYIYKAV